MVSGFCSSSRIDLCNEFIIVMILKVLSIVIVVSYVTASAPHSSIDKSIIQYIKRSSSEIIIISSRTLQLHHPSMTDGSVDNEWRQIYGQFRHYCWHLSATSILRSIALASIRKHIERETISFISNVNSVRCIMAVVLYLKDQSNNSTNKHIEHRTTFLHNIWCIMVCCSLSK